MNNENQSTLGLEHSFFRKIMPDLVGGVSFAKEIFHAADRRFALKSMALRRVRARTSACGNDGYLAKGSQSAAAAIHQSTMRNFTAMNHESREAVGRILNLLLADEYMLYKITRDYHWNVTGPDFFSLRLQFQLQHEAATGWVDSLSEYIRLLRLDARISWDDLTESARCSADSGFGLSSERMLSELLHAHEDIMAQLRSGIEICRYRLSDDSTAFFLNTLVEQHENAAWMLRAQLETAA